MDWTSSEREILVHTCVRMLERRMGRPVFSIFHPDGEAVLWVEMRDEQVPFKVKFGLGTTEMYIEGPACVWCHFASACNIEHACASSCGTSIAFFMFHRYFKNWVGIRSSLSWAEVGF